jgi:hypothetical protein
MQQGAHVAKNIENILNGQATTVGNGRSSPAGINAETSPITKISS